MTAQASITMSLITNSALFKTDKQIGHPQLALTFTNQVHGRSRRFCDRNKADEEAAEYIQVDTHLVIHVGEHSKKFYSLLDENIENNDDLAKAREAQKEAESELASVEDACDQHFAAIPGYSELLAQHEAAEQELSNLRERQEKNPGLKRELRGFVRQSNQLAAYLRQQLDAIKKANPAPMEIQTELDCARRRKADAEARLDESKKELRREKRVKALLREYLKKREIPHLDEKLLVSIAKRDTVLYELEMATSTIETDRSGLPFCMKMRKNKHGRVEVVDRAPCTTQVSIPWLYVVKAMTTPANVNRLYEPGGRRFQRHFVLALLIDQSKSIDSEDPVPNVGNLVIGAWPSRGPDGYKHGWAVILRKKQWIEIVKSIDFIRASGCLEFFLQLWPDESHKKLESQTAEEPADDEDEAAAEPAAASTEETDGGEAEPAETVEAAAELAAPSAAVIN